MMRDSSPFRDIPDRRTERWDRLREFVSQWYPPLLPVDGLSAEEFATAESRLQIRLPPALHEWYGIAGRRDDIWSRQDKFLRPDRLRIHDEHLIFYVENQGVVRWGIRVADLSSDDPPVFVSSADGSGQWTDENDTTSEFAIQMLVSCVRWADGHTGSANGAIESDRVIEAIASNYPRLPLREWSWAGTHQYHGDREVIAETDRGGTWLWVSTRSAAAFREFDLLMQAAGMQWEFWSDPAPGARFDARPDP
jgi:hypothetical protein